MDVRGTSLASAAMRAIQMTEFGGPEVLVLAELPTPQPGPGETLIKVTRAGLNFADTHTRTNSYVHKATLPLVPVRLHTIAVIGAHSVFLTFEDGTVATAIYNGYGAFLSSEITYDAGAVDFLFKPIEPAVLKAASELSTGWCLPK